MNARTLLIAIFGLAMLAFGGASSLGQGFSGLGTNAEGFAEVTPGKPIVFPADHGAHPNHRIEWWYLTANLKDAQGASYGVQWTLFRQAMMPNDDAKGWDSRQLWMGHAALTSANAHHFAERLARGGVGQAGVEAMPFKAWIDNWQFGAASADTASSLDRLQLNASAGDFSYALSLQSDHAPVLEGNAGYSQKAENGQASYYYSQPYLHVSGSILLDGKPIDVTGQAWMDHEWSSQPLAADETGWDWFSLHLDTGEKLMLFRLRHADGQHFFAGNWISADGSSEQLAPKDIVMSPIAQTNVAGRILPTAWKISIPSRKFDVRSEALNPQSWMDTRFKYWEGPIEVSGSQAGVGYLEMTGY